MNLLKSMLIGTITILSLVIGGTSLLNAYSTVTISPGAPVGTETAFLAATTTQFQASLITNPLFPGTYQVKLFGPNPNYNPPIINPIDATSVVNTFVSQSTTTYLYGWRDGAVYFQDSEVNVIGQQFGVNCSSPTAFQEIQTTTKTWSMATCQDVVTNIINQIFQLQLSTPTPIPGVP